LEYRDIETMYRFHVAITSWHINYKGWIYLNTGSIYRKIATHTTTAFNMP